MPFLDLTREVDSLRAAATSNRAELIIVYGRRGVGKRTLLAETLRDVRHIFYSATRRALPLQLADLTAIVRESYPDAFVPESFWSIEEFLRFLADLAGRHPHELVIAVLDELPYLAELDQGLLTVLQHWWDGNKRLPNLKLFLAGSCKWTNAPMDAGDLHRLRQKQSFVRPLQSHRRFVRIRVISYKARPAL